MRTMKGKQVENIHIGKMLSDVNKDKKFLMTEIASGIGLESSTVTYHHKRTELSSGNILKYSMFFKHNFFLDIAAKLPKDFTTNAPIAEKELQMIAALQKELQEIKDDFKIVKAERDLLKEIMGKK